MTTLFPLEWRKQKSEQKKDERKKKSTNIFSQFAWSELVIPVTCCKCMHVIEHVGLDLTRDAI